MRFEDPPVEVLHQQFGGDREVGEREITLRRVRACDLGKRGRSGDAGSGGGEKAAAIHSSTITEVAFTTAAALIPGARPRSSAASRVMIATTRAGPVTSSSTWASRPSILTSR